MAFLSQILTIENNSKKAHNAHKVIEVQKQKYSNTKGQQKQYIE